MKRTPLILFLLLATVVLLLQNCSQSAPCEGSLTLENPIPDTAVAVGDTLFIDLTDPPVFVSSEEEITYSPRIQYGYDYIDMNQLPNPKDGGNLTILRIIGISFGEAALELDALSNCLENSLTFNIIVTEP